MKSFSFLLAALSLSLIFICSGCKPCLCQEISKNLVVLTDTSNVKQVNENNFNEEVFQAKGFVLLEFSATWCPACKAISPILEEVANEFQGKLKVVRVDVNESSTLSTKCGVKFIPMLVILKDGKTVAVSIGMTTKTDLTAWLNQNMID